MRLMFICGASVHDGALKCPSWVRGMLPRLSDGFDVTILSADRSDVQEIRTLTVDEKKIDYVPESLWNDPERFAQLSKQADVIVIFGTERPYTLSAMRLCSSAGALYKTALFAQGMACACAEHYADGVPEKVIRRWTLRDLLRRENIRAEQQRMEARAADEREAIAMARHFIGRTAFDKSVLRSINADAAYYKCGDILRSGFYEGQWQYDACEKHRIFISQYYYPLKGFHYLLEAVSLLKETYPDIRICAAGYNPIRGSVAKNETKDSSYIRYLKSLIRRYGLEDHIELSGELDERRIKEEYLRANVFVLPSTIENSPNSLGEAMMLGVPSIAADVGGVSDFVTHEKDAILYPSSATDQLARYLDALFSDPARAERIGAAARVRAAADYDAEKNTRALQDTFETIAKSE